MTTSSYDFRSDTVTLPTPEMMAAVAAAPLGDSARGDDPTVNELERLAACLAGKDDALFLPSGTMANLAALLAHDVRGGEVIVEETAHIYNSEGGGLSTVAGAVVRPLRGRRGTLDPDDVKAAIRGAADLALAPTRLVCLENTHNAAGGSVIPLREHGGDPPGLPARRHPGSSRRRALVQRRGPSRRADSGNLPAHRFACGSRFARGWAVRSARSWPATVLS